MGCTTVPGQCSHSLFSSSPPLRMEAMLNEWLWQETFWLPSNARWKDIQMNDKEGRFPLPRDLLYTLPLAFAFIALRYVFERWDTSQLDHDIKGVRSTFSTVAIMTCSVGFVGAVSFQYLWSTFNFDLKWCTVISHISKSTKDWQQ